MRPEVISLGRSESHPLDLSKLRRDLSALWREEGRAKPGVARACQGTLAVLGVEESESWIEDLVRLYPARMILVRESRERSVGTVDASAGALCHRAPDGNALICSEILRLEAGPGSERRLASAIRSLTVGGLPLVVIGSRRSPLSAGWIHELGSAADAVIGNSNDLDEPEGIALWQRSLDARGGPPCSDAAWTGLVDWRRSVAMRFDGDGGRLNRLRTVAIETAATGGGRLKACLFAGWLASRLGWSPETPLGTREGARLRGADGPVEIRLKNDAVTDEALIHSVSFEFQDAEPLVWTRISREQAIVVEEGRTRISRQWIAHSKTSRAESVVDRLRRLTPDPVEREALRIAVRLAGAAP